MIPKKADDIAREYAEDIGIPPEHLVYMQKCVFQVMREAMLTYDYNMIFIPYLGTWFFRVWKIEEHVQKCNRILRQAVLPVSALETVQDLRFNLIKMDAIILAEMTRRKEEKENILENGVHNQRIYKQGCKCDKCRGDHNMLMNQRRWNRKIEKQREQYRQQLIKQHNETKG